MARRVLGLGLDEAAGVTGGLPCFGARLSNYMGHAPNPMVRALRTTGEGTGLLYGHGEHVTKHQCLVLGVETPPSSFQLPGEAATNESAAAARAAYPTMLDEYLGPAHVETYTVMLDRAESLSEESSLLARSRASDCLLVCCATTRMF